MVLRECNKQLTHSPLPNNPWLAKKDVSLVFGYFLVRRLQARSGRTVEAEPSNHIERVRNDIIVVMDDDLVEVLEGVDRCRAREAQDFGEI